MAQMSKNLPAIQENLAQSLSQEDPLDEEWQLTPILLPVFKYLHPVQRH